MRSLNIALNYYAEDVVNELIGRVLMQDIHLEGFDELTLSNFYDIIEIVD